MRGQQPARIYKNAWGSRLAKSFRTFVPTSASASASASSLAVFIVLFFKTVLNSLDISAERDPFPLPREDHRLRSRRVPAQPIWLLVRLRRPRPVQKQRSPLLQFRHPPIVHRIDPRQRQICLPHYRAMVRVDDLRYPPKVLHRLTYGTQKSKIKTPGGTDATSAVRPKDEQRSTSARPKSSSSGSPARRLLR